MVTLEAGELRLELNPQVGGSIWSFALAQGGEIRQILRAAGSHTNVLDAASFPLVPFVNRIRGGRFAFRGREVTLRPNMAGDPSPLHGQGWLNPWTVKRADERSASLTFHHEPGEWPWAYEAKQEFTLDEGGATIGLGCRNLDDAPMPCGLGQHPYFDCGAETRIAAQVSHAWTIDEHVLPVDKVPAEGAFDLSNRLVCGQGLDHGFGEWGGSAFISDPAWPYDLRMSSPNAAFFQLYSPAEGGVFVAEPVTHANAALNEPEEAWPALGLRVLEPGEAMHLDMRLDVIPKRQPPVEGS